MKPIKVQVKTEINTNWANEKYALFSTEKHGTIAELDFPKGDRGVRVYPVKQNEINKDYTNYVEFSSIPQGIAGAEKATKDYLFGKGYYVTKFIYSEEFKEMRKEAFKK